MLAIGRMCIEEFHYLQGFTLYLLVYWYGAFDRVFYYESL